jgi:hypothetical protein
VHLVRDRKRATVCPRHSARALGVAGELDGRRLGERRRRLRALPAGGAVDHDVLRPNVNELAETRAPNTVRRIYGVLNQVLRVAQQRRYIATNPCDAVQLPKRRRANGNGKPNGNRPRMTVLTPAEAHALAEAMPHYKAAVYVAGTLGEGDTVAGFEVVHLRGHAPGMIGLWREHGRVALVSDCFYAIDAASGRKGEPSWSPPTRPCLTRSRRPGLLCEVVPTARH